MSQRDIVVLTRASTVLDRIRSLSGDATLAGVTCLENSGVQSEDAIVVIDPGAVSACCYEAIRTWPKSRSRRQVVYLALPAPTGMLFTLPQIHPGEISRLSDIGDLLARRNRVSVTRAAWQDLERLSAICPHDERIERFQALASSPHPRGLTVETVSGTLGIRTRQLSRLVRTWFEYPPHVVLGLYRIACLARDLRVAESSPQGLATEHGYASCRMMSRQFRAYVGVGIEDYRRTTAGDAAPRDGSSSV